MVEEILLNGTWELRDEILTCDLVEARRLTSAIEGWIPTPVPGDIHQGLITAGRIREPLLGLNSFDCAWTESRSWWFRKKFDVDSTWQSADVVELELNGLDSNAEIFLNEVHIGSHRNAFRPFCTDVKRWLRPGQNVLLVRLSAGVENVSEADYDAPDGVHSTGVGEGIRGERGDLRRPLVRKPQYSFGWDWSPRLATTAIAGDVKLRVMKGACIRHVRLSPTWEGEQVVLVVTVTVEQFHYYKTANGTVRVALTDEQGRRYCAEQRGLLRSGYTHFDLELRIPDPQLWWPNGLGAQHLYRVEAEVEMNGERSAYPPFEYGLRFVELDTDGVFAIVINGKRVFCKGADWIPADALYARTTDERYETLIREARDANFNMLRVWGGGWYERDAFYRACDRYGIMVWHDFMFACAPYPDHLEWFRIEVEKEAEYQTQRLGHHACIVLWCGNNENNWAFRDWWHEQTKAGAWIYNYLLPAVTRRNTPGIPYWNGSPYGGDEPNSSEVGDRHHWNDCMMNPDMEKRITPEEYDKCTALFVSEFGYIGAPSKETILTYMDGAPLDQRSETWRHHTNTFEKETVLAGIRKHYLPSLSGPESLSLDDYVLYSGLCQGLMYSYALDSMRYRENCYGSLFWMYNDCWGEIGWTIIDYYLRRKPSYYFVRRAFAPLRLIMRPLNTGIRVVLANDTLQTVSFDLEYGYLSLDGRLTDLRRKPVTAAALTRTELVVFERGGHDPTNGLWIARPVQEAENLSIQPAIFRATDYARLRKVDPQLTFTVRVTGETTAEVNLKSQGYAHAVHLVLPEGALPSDDYFDLLPGEERVITIVSRRPLDVGSIGVTHVK